MRRPEVKEKQSNTLLLRGVASASSLPYSFSFRCMSPDLPFPTVLLSFDTVILRETFLRLLLAGTGNASLGRLSDSRIRGCFKRNKPVSEHGISPFTPASPLSSTKSLTAGTFPFCAVPLLINRLCFLAKSRVCAVSCLRRLERSCLPIIDYRTSYIVPFPADGLLELWTGGFQALRPNSPA